jgi:hypothetical protein
MFEIEKFGACDPAVKFRSQFTTFEEAWIACPRGDWMLWIASKVGVEDKLIIKTAALCANTVRHLMTDKRSTDAIDIALKYAEGLATKDELRAAYAAAAYARADARADARAAADDAYKLQTATICREYLTDAVFQKIK